ncbi:hypothetical protein AVEN_19545-1 [Araneus ventricosus]|uniref:Integrase zinc-binding domain-containing protein n=1 Tax=Araneus ventricosus TaxID=182803 RepID=A0A4Y2RME2_ARAVE|nr:hypothetical protein AVEN_19545-1 [Araneus ventricosus]
MKSLDRCYVWWPKIVEDIENHVGLCEPRQQTRHAVPRALVHPWKVTTKSWSKQIGPLSHRPDEKLHWLVLNLHQKLKRIQLVLLPLQCNRPAQTFQLSRVIFQLKSRLLRRPLMNPIKTDLDEP